jgi:hypothetical protein
MREKEEGKKYAWKDGDFCGVMEVQSGTAQPRKDADLCYMPSSGQKLYDAVIVPRDTWKPVTVLQITVGDGHSVAIEEFLKLRDSLPNEKKFNFLMIRVAVNLDDELRMESNVLKWSMENHGEKKMTLDEINDLVDFYECILNFEKALVRYQKSGLQIDIQSIG